MMERGDIIRKVQSRFDDAYSRWGLRTNPFVKTAPPDHVRRQVFTDRIPEMERLIVAILSNPNNLLVYGPYGIGKTVFLLESLSEISAGRDLLAVYTTLEGSTAADFDLSVLLALSEAMKQWDQQALELYDVITGITLSTTTSGEGGAEIGTGQILPISITVGGKMSHSREIHRNSVPHPRHHLEILMEKALKRYKRVVIAVDELEKREPTEYHNLVTGCRATLDLQCSFVLTGGLWATWLTQNPRSAASGAFSETIKLDAFDQTTARQVVIAYLNSARDKRNDSPGPFSEEAIHHIIDVSEGVPRRFNEICYHCLNQAIEVQIDGIDVQFVDTTLERTGIQQYFSLLEGEQHVVDVITKHGGTLSDTNTAALQELGAITIFDLYATLENLVRADVLVKKEDARNIHYQVSPAIQKSADIAKIDTPTGSFLVDASVRDYG